LRLTNTYASVESLFSCGSFVVIVLSKLPTKYNKIFMRHANLNIKPYLTKKKIEEQKRSKNNKKKSSKKCVVHD